jgi:hypothetical protein
MGGKPTGTAVIPYQQAITNKISGLLAKHNIRTIHIWQEKNRQILMPVKDNLGLSSLMCTGFCMSVVKYM